MFCYKSVLDNCGYPTLLELREGWCIQADRKLQYHLPRGSDYAVAEAGFPKLKLDALGRANETCELRNGYL